MTERALEAAISADGQVQDYKWTKLREIIESNYTVKNTSEDLMQVETSMIDIEVRFNKGLRLANNFTVSLWYLTLPEGLEELNLSGFINREFNTIREVVVQIDSIVELFEMLGYS